MNPEQQRIAIAEWCGWTSIEITDYGSIERVWYNPKGKVQDLPDYLNDLNAMWEAEERLDINQWREYAHAQLLRVVGTTGPNMILSSPANYRNAMHATAAKRAEALLRTIGKWNEKTAQPEG